MKKLHGEAIRYIIIDNDPKWLQKMPNYQSLSPFLFIQALCYEFKPIVEYKYLKFSYQDVSKSIGICLKFLLKSALYLIAIEL